MKRTAKLVYLYERENHKSRAPRGVTRRRLVQGDTTRPSRSPFKPISTQSKVLNRLLDLLLRIDNKRAVLHHLLVERFSSDQNKVRIFGRIDRSGELDAFFSRLRGEDEGVVKRIRLGIVSDCNLSFNDYTSTSVLDLVSIWVFSIWVEEN